MEVKSVYIWVGYNDVTSAKATINVPGLGDVEIEHALSKDLMERIMAESLTSLCLKLGQVITTNPQPDRRTGSDEIKEEEAGQTERCH